MKTMEELRRTPVLLLTDEEITRFDTEFQVWARKCQEQHKLEAACPNHEPTGTSTRNGWHSLKCKHCGKDMSYDSGD